MEEKIKARIAREFVTGRSTDVRSQLLRYLESGEERHYSRQVQIQLQANEALRSTNQPRQREIMISDNRLNQARALRAQATAKKYGADRQRIFGGAAFQWFWDDQPPPPPPPN